MDEFPNPNDDVGPAEPEGLAQALLSAFGDAEKDQVNGWQSLLSMHAAAQVLFQREAMRLEDRLGAGAPQVLDLKTRIRTAPFLFKGAEVALGDAKLPTPAVAADAAVVQGRIADDQGRGVDGLQVQWEDEKGQALPNLGRIRTDAAGYFSVSFAAGAMAKLPPGGAYLLVRNAAGTVLHREAAPLQPAMGGLTRVSILLNRRTAGPSSSTVFTAPPRDATGAAPDPRPAAEPFRARGRALASQGQGAPGLLVVAWDRDRLFDDNLGSALTGPDGSFEIVYGMREFREGETGPDLYLTVGDATGKELLRTPVRPNAGRDEVFELRLPPGSQGNPGVTQTGGSPTTGPANDPAPPGEPPGKEPKAPEGARGPAAPKGKPPAPKKKGRP